MMELCFWPSRFLTLPGRGRAHKKHRGFVAKMFCYRAYQALFSMKSFKILGPPHRLKEKYEKFSQKKKIFQSFLEAFTLE